MALMFTSGVLLGKLLNFSELSFLHLENEGSSLQ